MWQLYDAVNTKGKVQYDCYIDFKKYFVILQYIIRTCIYKIPRWGHFADEDFIYVASCCSSLWRVVWSTKDP